MPPPPRHRLLEPLVLLAILVWFLFLSADSLRSKFAADDPQNIHGYFARGLATTAVDCILFFRPAYRPLGGVFYLSLFETSHLDPAPYHAVLIVLLVFNLLLAYAFFRTLTGSWPTAVPATFLICYHGNLIALYHYASYIYDILCFTFYYGFLLLYLRQRRTETPLSWRTVFVLLALYIAALDAKEMALTLPLFVLACEFGFSPRTPARARLLAPMMGVTLLFVAGCLFGSGGLATQSGYHIEPSLRPYLEASAASIGDIFYSPPLSLRIVPLIWLIILGAAILTRSLPLAFAAILTVFGHVLTAIIGRGGGPGLYIPLAGWALLIAILLTAALKRLLRRTNLVIALVPVVVLVLAVGRFTYFYKRQHIHAVYSGQVKTWSVIQALQALPRTPLHGGKVLILDDPFEEWDMFFLARLWFHSPTLSVALSRKDPAAAASPSQFTDIFAFRCGGSLARLR